MAKKRIISPVIHVITTGTTKILIFFIVGLRPLLGPAHCKYAISCSEYALIQLKTKPLLKAIWLITKRICSCNPFTKPKEKYNQ